MRILITNDDSINAPGLLPLVQWAKTKGEVIVAAPKFEQSGKSHSIEIHKPFEVKKVDLFEGVEAYAVDSSPADCVRFMVLGLGKQIDLVISGVNKGLNIGRDVMYSGTVSAVFEAGNMDIPAMAVSTTPEYYMESMTRLEQIWQYIQKYELLKKNLMYNVNIPDGGSDVIRITRQGGIYYSDDFKPIGNDLYEPCGKDVFQPTGNSDLDADAVLIDKVISIMPLTVDRTEPEVYCQLKALND